MKIKEFEHIYKEYSGRMLSICVRYMGDKALAQDIMHDGFIHIYNSFHKFSNRGEGSLRAWMDRVMINTCLQYYRKNNKFKLIEFEPKHIEESVTNHDIKDIPADLIHKFIAELPFGYRTVFNMFVLDGMSHKEIGEELGINEKSSSSQLYRARLILMDKIKEYERR